MDRDHRLQRHLLAAGLLFLLASGPVRGFGVTHAVGVLASMVSALVVARLLTEAALSARWLRRRPRLTGLASGGAVRGSGGATPT